MYTSSVRCVETKDLGTSWPLTLSSIVLELPSKITARQCISQVNQPQGNVLKGALSLTSNVSKTTVMLSNGSGGSISHPQLTLNPALGRLSLPSVMRLLFAVKRSVPLQPSEQSYQKCPGSHSH
jgi:hypothetical protein